MKYTRLVLVIFIVLVSCTGKTNNTPEEKQTLNTEKIPFMKDLVLVVSNGSRAHIININSLNELSYKVGSFFVCDRLEENSFVYNENYKERKKELSDSQSKTIIDYCQDSCQLSYNDKKVVKDSWEYYLFINKHQISYGREANFNDFPQELKELITFILNTTGDLYNIGGMS